MRSKRQFFSGVPFSLAVAALAALAARAPAQSTDGSEPGTWRDTAARWRDRMIAQADEIGASSRAFVDKHLGDQPPMCRMRGLYTLETPIDPEPVWTALADGARTPERVVLLVHGLDEVGDLWTDLVEPLSTDPRLAGAGVLRFEYRNDQAIALSADELDGALKDLYLRGTRRVDLVCHSMGGLVARDVLTRAGMYAGTPRGHADRPDLTNLVTLGTPNHGSPLAKLRALAQLREVVERWVDSENHNVRDLFRACDDGDGKAGDDLMPDSPYLAELNARPLPPSSEIPITLVIGRVTTAEDLRLDRALAAPTTVKILGEERATTLLEACREFTRGLGDGVVSCSSAFLDGATLAVVVEATHRSMIRTLKTERVTREALGKTEPTEPPGIKVVLQALAGA